jgi:hypothetical protein
MPSIVVLHSNHIDMFKDDVDINNDSIMISVKAHRLLFKSLSIEGIYLQPKIR